MITGNLARLLILVVAAAAGMPGIARAQQPVRIGASISLTGTYAKPGAYGRDGYLLCQKRVVDERGFQTGHKMVTIQWQEGKQVVVRPEDVAAGKARFPTPPWKKR